VIGLMHYRWTLTVNTVTVNTVIDTDVAEALLETLRAATGSRDLRYSEAPAALTGGFYAEMLRFRLDDPPAALRGELVARIIPNAELGEWEAAIQGAVASTGFPTAAVRLSVGADGPLGRYLIVMDYLEGRSPLDGLGINRILRDAPKLARTLPRTLARIAAQLHAVDAEPITRSLAALSTTIPVTSGDFVAAMAHTAEQLGRDDLAGAAQKLLADAPHGNGLLAVCHGDLHPFNVLVTSDGPALLDWTTARVAHPAYDLAFTELLLAHPPIEIPRTLRRPVLLLARRFAKRFLREYAAIVDNPSAALDPRELEWHRRLHALRSLVELAGWDAIGTRPQGHPWITFEPIARNVLRLPQLVTSPSRSE
jgi:aminoglycoside phosphotransferase (APT) family kinase protein